MSTIFAFTSLVSCDYQPLWYVAAVPSCQVYLYSLLKTWLNFVFSMTGQVCQAVQRVTSELLKVPAQSKNGSRLSLQWLKEAVLAPEVCVCLLVNRTRSCSQCKPCAFGDARQSIVWLTRPQSVPFLQRVSSRHLTHHGCGCLRCCHPAGGFGSSGSLNVIARSAAILHRLQHASQSLHTNSSGCSSLFHFVSPLNCSLVLKTLVPASKSLVYHLIISLLLRKLRSPKHKAQSTSWHGIAGYEGVIVRVLL